MAALAEDEGDDVRALAAYRGVLEVAGDEPRALSALDRILERRGEWRELEAVLSASARCRLCRPDGAGSPSGCRAARAPARRHRRRGRAHRELSRGAAHPGARAALERHLARPGHEIETALLLEPSTPSSARPRGSSRCSGSGWPTRARRRAGDAASHHRARLRAASSEIPTKRSPRSARAPDRARRARDLHRARAARRFLALVAAARRALSRSRRAAALDRSARRAALSAGPALRRSARRRQPRARHLRARARSRAPTSRGRCAASDASRRARRPSAPGASSSRSSPTIPRRSPRSPRSMRRANGGASWRRCSRSRCAARPAVRSSRS